MAWYRCFVRGENLSGQILGEAGLIGFFVTCFVEAGDEQGAETNALQMLRNHPKLNSPTSRNSSARIYFDEIEQVLADNVPTVQPGFTWHRMEQADPK